MDEEMTRGVQDPIFGDPSDAEPVANYGILIGGMASYDEESMALAYKAAGDMLVEEALRSADRSWEVAMPVLFLYRHTIELYLKWAVQPARRDHDIAKLVEEADAIAVRRVGKAFPDWAKARLLDFANYDPRGTVFRYTNGPHSSQAGEYWIDLHHLRQVMSVLTDGLAKLARLQQSARDGAR